MGSWAASQGAQGSVPGAGAWKRQTRAGEATHRDRQGGALGEQSLLWAGTWQKEGMGRGP